MLAQKTEDVARHLEHLSRTVCTFGPLRPAPGKPTDATVQLVIGDTVVNTASEVADRDLAPEDHGFEYQTSNSGAYVVLTARSCEMLGTNPRAQLIVRWQ